MSTANEYRLKLSYTLLAAGALIWMLGFLWGSAWGVFTFLVGGGLFAMGAVMFLSLSVIKGVPWLTYLISRHMEPAWEGELVYVEGNGLKVRYDFDHNGSPWFIAKDVCIAVGIKSPQEIDLACGGVAIMEFDGHLSFSETNVQNFLISLAMNNHAANRLLVNIRNNVLRKLDKQRDEKRRHANS
jgi:hypothetical protein